MSLSDEQTRSVNALQGKIMGLGDDLTMALPVCFSSSTVSDIAEYFRHNEYGLAIDLLEYVLEEERLELNGKAAEFYQKVKWLMVLVEKIYHSAGED